MHIAADIGGVERRGAVDIKTNFGFFAAFQCAAETGRNVNHQHRRAVLQHGSDVGFAFDGRLLDEIARAGKIFGERAALHGLVAVVHGVFQVLHVKRNPPRHRCHNHDGAHHGEKQADFVAQEFGGFAAGKRKHGGEPIFQRIRIVRHTISFVDVQAAFDGAPKAACMLFSADKKATI